MTDEIECPDCDGKGQVDRQHLRPQLIDCDACDGKGWREPTQEELNDMAADAFSDMCEGEPPLSFAERTEMQAKRDAQWGVK